jgi:multimeric flavodoxin WrbA
MVRPQSPRPLLTLKTRYADTGTIGTRPAILYNIREYFLEGGNMKVIAIVGSPRKNGNTEILTSYTLKAIAEEGLDTELVRLAGLDIKPCNACMVCAKEEQCSIKDDLFPIYLKMKAADGIILASPVYYGSATALIKAFMRRAGHNFTIAQLTLWFQILGLVVPGSTYWNVAVAREKGEVTNDEEGMKTAWNFGKNIAWVLKKLKSA